MAQDKEEYLVKKRILELAENAYRKDVCFYTDYLNLNELNLFFGILKELPDVSYEIWGGYDLAERKMIGFYTKDSFQKPMFPVKVIKIEPVHEKFSDELTHRDYLGAILNLGIERGKIGDILVDEKCAFVFCNCKISEFIIEQLKRIKHTNIRCSYYETDHFDYVPRTDKISGTVSSVRLDSILSVAFHSSRSSLAGLAAGGKVYVNGRLIESNSYVLKENDVVSVRGLGKFVFVSVNNQTKKGRYSITIAKYV